MAEVEVRIEHTYDEEWVWDVSRQTYLVSLKHRKPCIACLMGIKED